MHFERARDYALNYIRKATTDAFRYHNRKHTLDVWQSVTRLAGGENIPAKESLLLQTAALFHDTGITISYQMHEEESVKIVCNVLPEFGYSTQDISVVSQLIIATRISRTPENKMEMLMCDADLDYLGRTDYPEISERLRQEWIELRIISYDIPEWLAFQLAYLQNHEYHTACARNTRNPGKAQNIKKIQDLMKKV